jgi:hypothetical protein
MLPLIALRVLFVLQKLIAKTRFGSMSEVRTVTSRKPACWRRIGRTFSLIVFATAADFWGLVLTSTTRVNIGSSPFVGYAFERNVA